MPRVHKSAVLAALMAFLLLPGVAPAAKDKARAPEKPAVEEKAAQVFEKSCAALKALTGYSFRADVTLDKVYQDGSKIQSGRTMEVMVQRPASFRVTTAGDEFQAVSVFDGKTFTIAMPARKAYGQIPAALDTDALMDMLANTYGLESPLGDLLSNTPCDTMKPVAGYYVGKSMVGATSCDHLFFRGKDIDWQLWIEDGPQALPRKIVITEKKLPMAPQFSAVLGGWKTGAIAPETFAYVPPQDFTRDDGVITGNKPANKSGK
jgi:hypothetical protein